MTSSRLRHLSRESRRASALGDQRALQRVADEIAALLAVDDPEAVAIYEAHQAKQLGPDPLAEGAESWPDALSVRRGHAITVSSDSPLFGWRAWRFEGDRLLAPFKTVKQRLPAGAPGITWGRGTNQNRPAARCERFGRGPTEPHPRADCRCGIRVVQSLTVLERFAVNMESVMGGDLAFGRVAFWGRVAPWAPDDDWRHTARAQYAAIVGDFLLHEDDEHLRPGLVARYGSELEA